MSFTIEQGVVPTGPQHAAWPDFVAGAEIRNLISRESYGSDEHSISPFESLPNWKDEARPRIPFYARANGQVVGRAIEHVLVGHRETAWLQVLVHPSFRALGIGRAFAELLEGRARRAGRSKLIIYATSPDSAGERLASPTGFGSLPLANREVQCLLTAGYRLEQIERGSRLALPVKVDLPAAQARSGSGYRVHCWTGATPPEWLDDIAALLSRMSTDAPSAGLDEPEDVFTPERVRQLEANEALGGRPALTAAAEHIASARLAGFTKLSVAAERDRPISQEETLVLREHRGHSLGMLLKLANLEYAQREFAGHPAVSTFNAEENRYMLDVNEAIGFVPIGYEGAWRKDL